MDPIISLRNATVGYGSLPAVSHVTVDVASGTLTALIGPNGSGKSTLMDAIAGLRAPMSGTITLRLAEVGAGTLDTTDRVGAQPGRASHGVAYVMQQTATGSDLPLTVEEVVTMGRYANVGAFGRLGSTDRRAVSEAMEAVDIAPLARRQLRELSGGQRQRALVAQGLAQRGAVMLLDEPVTGVDLVSRQLIDEAMRSEQQRGRTVLFSTHDLRDAESADQVLLLSGRIVASGSPGQVLTAENLRRAYGRRLIDVGSDSATVDEHGHSHAHDAGRGPDQDRQRGHDPTGSRRSGGSAGPQRQLRQRP